MTQSTPPPDTNSPLPPLVKGAISMEAMRSDPLHFLSEQTRLLGDIFRYESEGWSTVVVSHPSHIKHVLHTNSKNYTKLGTPDLMMLKPMLGVGLMTSEGAAWAEQREMVRPAFDNQRLNLMVGSMAEAADAMIGRWEAGAGSGAPIDVVADLSFVTLRIVTKCLFGAELDGETTDFGAAVQVQNEVMAHFDPADVGRLIDFEEAKAAINRIVGDIISRRRIENVDRGDLLSILMAARWADGSQLSEREIRDQIFTFLMAGHETTAKCLSWALFLLHQNPEAHQRVREEASLVLAGRVPTARDVADLEFTWMVLQEGMRLYPPVWLMSRRAVDDDVLGGYRVPRGSLVVVSPYVMHRHEKYWSEPLRFAPERFHPQSGDDRDPYCYFPFSGGPRICIGRRFAMLETPLVLAMIVSRVQLELVPGHPVVPEALVTLRPKHGLLMTARRT